MTRNQAFTLTELAVVITIIATLLAGATVAQNLADTAKLNKVVISLKEIERSIASFKTTYEALPGDFNRATSYFSSSANGDGDGEIEDRETISGNVRESLRAWQHLSSAKVIRGNYRGIGTSLVGEVNIPVTNLDGVSMNFSYKFAHDSSAWVISSGIKNTIHAGSIISSSIPYSTSGSYVLGSGFSSYDAKRLDDKFDDSGKFSGNFVWPGGREASDSSWDSCASFTAVDHNVHCLLIYNLGKL